MKSKSVSTKRTTRQAKKPVQPSVSALAELVPTTKWQNAQAPASF